MKAALRYSLLLSLFLLTSAVSTAAPTVKLKHLKITQFHGKYIQQIDYPQICGLPDAELERRINARLANGSWPKESVTASDIEPGERLTAEVSCTVYLNEQGLLSIEYRGLQVLSKKGKMISAYPSNLINSHTIDLNTGKTYAWIDLFKTGSHYEAIISKCLKKECEGYDPDESSASKRSFYLTPKSLIVIFPNACHAMQGAEVSIPLKDLASIASPQGPIARLLKP